MSDIRSIARSIEIHLPDESCIELDLSITIQTESSGSIANDRVGTDTLSNVIEAIQVMLITSLEKSQEEIEEMAADDAT